jgi:hypothetical protein
MRLADAVFGFGMAIALGFVLAAVLSFVLSGCASAPSASISCVPMAAYTSAQETAIGDELAALAKANPADPVVAAMGDYTRLRAADRACAGAAPVPSR